jgi:hypothetical protein
MMLSCGGRSSAVVGWKRCLGALSISSWLHLKEAPYTSGWRGIEAGFHLY